MNTHPHLRSILATRAAAAAALLCLTPAPLRAIDKFWIDANGGSFGDIFNWDNTEGGPGGDPVPGVADIANFTLNNTYTVIFAAGPTNTDLDVENGNVTFDLNNLTYTLTSGSGIAVGNVPAQTGRLTVTHGTLGVNTNGDDVYLGLSSSGTGFLTISTGGRLGTGALRAEIFVGLNNTGTLTVNDNGRIDGETLSLGTNNSSTSGTVVITGPNAVADISGSTSIGANGAGTLTVSSGGTLTSTGGATVGSSLGSDGTATVSGAGSSWVIPSTTTIGSGGDGTLTISSGGLVSSTGIVLLGNSAAGFGTATVSGAGSRWNVSALQSIGSGGLGVMTVSSGGQVASSFAGSIGVSAGGEGRVTVTGAGSQWTLGDQLTVGAGGTGDLTVSGGGEVSALTLFIGNVASGVGEATITGAGSKLTASGNVTVANLGTGTLNVASGAEVYAGGNLVVNDPAAAPIGTLNLDGGSIYVTGAFTNNSVFNFTDGLLQVKGNFQPSAAAAPLTLNGSDNGNLPTLDLIGTGTTTNVTALSIGTNRRGQLLLRQGRVLDVAANSINIGTTLGGEGTVSVQSGAQLLTVNNLQVGGIGAVAGGTGTLDISGGTVDIVGLRIFTDGTINLSSGTLAVSFLTLLDGQFNWTGGTLRFDAAITLDSTNVPKLLGLDATLNAGQALTSTAAVTLQTPLTVDGGALNASLLINQSRLEVRSGSIGAVQNDGLLFGDGTISGAVTNNAAGRIRVDAGKTLAFTGPFSPNAGELNLQGGTLDFTGAITNGATGFIAGRGAIYSGGVTNNGQMAFSGGTADIHGDVTNAVGARITTSGGATTTFFDDVVHNGTEIRTSAGSASVFFGAVSGAGPFTGTGTVYFEGDLRPGNSPASVLYEGDLVFGSTASLILEIGGLMSGAEYDHLDIGGVLHADGDLVLALLDGFTPQLGDTFDLLDVGAFAGDFDTITAPALSGGNEWDFSALKTTGSVTVVPEPGVGALLLSALGFVGMRRARLRVARSSRALVSASRRNELPDAFDSGNVSALREVWKVREGGTPSPTLGTSVLPGFSCPAPSR